ncbi:SGNH/GDSL hydrolase family protein [Leifsonia sp. F6_8S_P_1B]|uniref:SGNH/GDSL hydrolase family protein n=1 Tax=Leifsonia williamsii TaxID=3035919 RepID=A0ABT8KEW0_9MICO|nr:SGNH/GDSL hydrolase family protein [Leifsonia williamsii]MDN4615017.1 SGNH/GDSL hydrolase family protein [Leifsonia williamsii]
MTARRPLTALALAAVSALALAGCSSASAAPDGGSATATGPADGLRVAVIGDSIAAGLGVEDGEAWPDLLAAENGWRLSNLSSSGAGFVATDGDGDDFGPQVTAAIAADAQLVLVGASDNDLGADDADARQATADAVQQLREGLPHAQIVGYGALTGEATDEQLADVDQALRDAVTAAGGVWLDLGQPYRSQEGLVQDDGEHPTAAGQRAIAMAVRSALAAAGVTVTTTTGTASSTPSP